jgi:hypothetical protein
VLDPIGFPQDGIVESDIGPDHDTYSRQRLGCYFEGIVERMIENEAVTMTNDGLNISEDYELFIKGELNKYVEMLLNELDNPNPLGQDFYLAREQDNLPLNLRCPRMTSVLYVHFDMSFKSGSSDFKIHSPLVLPTEGETVDFEWRNFLDNEALIEEMEIFAEGSVWICNVLFKKYYKNQIETHITLMDEKSYREHLKHSRRHLPTWNF